jgi:hypothetical protein
MPPPVHPPPRTRAIQLAVLMFTISATVLGTHPASADRYRGEAPCDGRLRRIPGPTIGDSMQLHAVSSDATGGLWAVGIETLGFHPIRTLIERWDGSDWSIVPSPSPGVGGNFLFGVSATAADDAWAVGEQSTGGLFVISLIEHWDGSVWSAVPSPLVGSQQELDGVTAISPNDAWAVGWYQNPDDANLYPLTEHWDGTAWQSVPDGHGGRGVLISAAAVSATDVWTVGWSLDEFLVQRMLLEHWDGTRWTDIPVPDPYVNSYLSGVAADSSSHAWAVGAGTQDVDWDSIALEWSGSFWKHVPSPSPDDSTDLFAVAIDQTGGAWAVGHAEGVGHADEALAERWDGAGWTAARTASPGEAENVLLGVSTTRRLAAIDVWAVGYASGPDQQALIEHACLP